MAFSPVLRFLMEHQENVLGKSRAVGWSAILGLSFFGGGGGGGRYAFSH